MSCSPHARITRHEAYLGKSSYPSISMTYSLTISGSMLKCQPSSLHSRKNCQSDNPNILFMLRSNTLSSNSAEQFGHNPSFHAAIPCTTEFFPHFLQQLLSMIVFLSKGNIFLCFFTADFKQRRQIIYC